ncbi:MAG TPA: DegV family protein [Syntrophomonas sp.]|nr:DegV family protein [Syntrophomonas sp.]
MGIKIVTDNCCDLPVEILERYKIRLVHLQVRFGDRVYLPGELNNEQFYKLMADSQILPSTSQPTVEETNQVYSEALADGSEVIAIHMSSGLSGTYQGGVLVKNTLDNPNLYVFDSLKASVGMGLMVVQAARMVEQGATVPEILQRLQEMQSTMQCVFLVGNLESLIKGGRVSKAKGKIAVVFDIKPVLHINEEGFIMPYDKVRGVKGAQHKLINIMEKNGSNLALQTVGVCHSAVPEIANALSETIKEKFAVKEVIIGDIGPVIGAHVGAGTFSVFFEK